MKHLFIGLVLATGLLVHGGPLAAEPDGLPFAATDLRGADDPLVTDGDFELLRKAFEYQAAGEYEQSLATYRQVYGQLKGRLRQDDHPLLLEILSLVTDVFLSLGQFQQAEGTLLKQIEMQELKLAKPGRAESEQSVERACIGAAKVKLGLILAQLGRLDEAAEPLAEGVGELESVLGRQHRLVLESQLLLGRTLWNQGRFTEAVSTLEGVVSRLPGSEGLPPAVAMAATEEAGEMLLSLGRIAEAIALWDRTVVALETRLPPLDPGLVVAYRRLGEAYAANGDFAAAEDYWRKSLRITRRVFGETSGEAAADFLAISVVMELLDNTVGAVNYFDLATAGFDRAESQGGISANQLRFCRRAAGLLLSAGLNQQATRVVRCVAEAAESQPQQSVEEAAATAAALGRCQLAAGEATAAEGQLRAALSKSIRGLGKGHVITLEIVELLAASAVEQGQTDLAASLIDVLFKAAPARLTSDREFRLAETVANTAGLLEQQEQPQRAQQLRDQWLALREQQYAANGPEVAELLVAFADGFQATGRTAEAIPLYERAVTVRERAHGNDHPAVAAVLVPLARAQRAQRQDAEAEQVARRSLAIWELTLPPSHAVVVETLKMLTGAMYAQEKYAEVIPYYQRLLEVFERQSGPRSLQVEKLLLRLADVAAAIDDTEAAAGYRARAAAISGN